MENHFDVLIVGAGLSGICAAYYLGARCPQKSYTILEARSDLGGTWDLFRYPGIRSDSDMYTLGLSFHPWRNPKAIADGPSILAYLHETAERFDIDRHIEFERRVDHAAWSSDEQRWTITATDPGSGSTVVYTCDFLWSCTGYYRYDQGHTPHFEGIEQFEGRVVHPQQWTDDIEWEGQRVVVIGSGATAVTLVPELARTAAHVTMLQRSPTYMISRPASDPIAENLTSWFGQVGYTVARWKNIFLMTVSYHFARRFPTAARRLLLGQVRRAVGDAIAAQHFEPSYDPWDQRLCLIPDHDLFDAINEQRASVVTDQIEHFTTNGLLLKSGEEIAADLVVTATGLQLQMAGGCEIEVDGVAVHPGDRMLYKGTMLSGVPNAVMSLGYTNASWTLKCELIADYVCRLLNHMTDHGHSECRPRDPGAAVDAVPLIDFNAGYITRALADLPTQGSKLPWRLYQNYLLDQFLFRHTQIADGVLEFRQRAL